MNETIFQYQIRADPLQQTTATTPTQPFLLLDLPVRPRWIPPTAAVLPLADVFGQPCTLIAVPVSRRWGLHEGYAARPPVALPYDLPLSAHAPLPLIRRPLVPTTQTPEWRRSDVAAPTYFTPSAEVPIRRPRRTEPTRTPEWGRADVAPPVPTLIGLYPQVPIRRTYLRQSLTVPAQNHLPIPQPAPPNGSWYPGMEVAMRRRRSVATYLWFVQNLPPISTPAYLSSFWDTYRPSETWKRRGLLVTLQQAYAAAPPSVVVLVQLAPWKPLFPELLRRLRLLPTYPSAVGPVSQTAVAAGVGCIMVDQAAVTSSTLLSPETTTSTLVEATLQTTSTLVVAVETSTCVDPTLTNPTLLRPDLC